MRFLCPLIDIIVLVYSIDLSRSKQIPEIIRVKETTVLALDINNVDVLLL
jgi:hypothetical protein